MTDPVHSIEHQIDIGAKNTSFFEILLKDSRMRFDVLDGIVRRDQSGLVQALRKPLKMSWLQKSSQIKRYHHNRFTN